MTRAEFDDRFPHLRPKPAAVPTDRQRLAAGDWTLVDDATVRAVVALLDKTTP